MSWKEEITTIINNLDVSAYLLNEPATAVDILTLKQSLNLAELPEELETLYSLANGIITLNNGKAVGELVWPIDKVIATNTDFRTHADFKELYMSFSQLLFFAEDTNGDLFAFVTLNGKFDRFDIFKWQHETDSRTWITGNLSDFIEQRIKDILKQ